MIRGFSCGLAGLRKRGLIAEVFFRRIPSRWRNCMESLNRFSSLVFVSSLQVISFRTSFMLQSLGTSSSLSDLIRFGSQVFFRSVNDFFIPC